MVPPVNKLVLKYTPITHCAVRSYDGVMPKLSTYIYDTMGVAIVKLAHVSVLLTRY